MWFFRKRAKKGQERAKYLKIWAKIYKLWKYFEKGSLMRATIAHMKQLEYAYTLIWIRSWEKIFKKIYFEKYFFKLMNNTVFGKTIENVRKHRNIKLVTTKTRSNYLLSEWNYHTAKKISKMLLAIGNTILMLFVMTLFQK